MFGNGILKKAILKVARRTAVAAALAIPSFSYAVTWDLTCGLGTTCTFSGISYGNEVTFTTSGLTLVARAFSTSNNDGGGNFQTAFLGWYPFSGLGVTAQGLILLGGDGLGLLNQFTVDNTGKNDLVVFKFPTSAYIPASVFLNAFNDTDIVAYIGGDGLSFSNFTSLSYATLASNGFTACTSGNSGGFSDRLVNLSPCNLGGHFLIIGAANRTESTDNNDYFNIGSLTANAGSQIAVNSVSEPGTMFLLGFGLIGLRIFISYRYDKMKQLPAKAP